MREDIWSAEPDQCVDADQAPGLTYVESDEPLLAEFGAVTDLSI